jgi:DNA replication and repair protein RecF
MNPVDGVAVAQDLCDIEKYNTHTKKISLSSLSLSNFRNYDSERIEISQQPVVITGANGAGKTNILEAISLLSVGRGLRRAKLSDISNVAAGQNWAISANLNGKLGHVKIGTGIGNDGLEDNDKRLVKIDGKITRGQAELARHVSLIWLTPQMEQLFIEGASAGRKFLDRLVFSFDAEHASRVNEYEYHMRERNKLLQYGRADAGWLATTEQKMAGCAAAIATARLSTCEHINHMIASSPLSFPKGLLNVSGFVEDSLKAGNPAMEAENSLKNMLESSRNYDAASGRTSYGTHRSELGVIHIEKSMPAESCSTGEQKALLLSIILAQARSGSIWHRTIPIILLDEVVSHLDATRRLELFEEICDIGAQTWMTGTDAQLFAGLKEKAQFFKVENGKIFKE